MLLSVVLVYSVCVWGFIVLLRDNILGLSNEVEMNRTAITFLMAWSLALQATCFCSTSLFHGVQRKLPYILQLLNSSIMFLLVYTVFFLSSQDKMNGIVGSVIYILNGTTSTLIFTSDWVYETENEDGVMKGLVASRRAKALLGESDFKKITGIKRAKLIFMISLPVYFVFGVGLLYIIVVFTVFKAYDSNEWKVSVTLVAFGIKVARNKVVLKFVGEHRPWMADLLLYVYEFATALLLRILQMSLPDEQTARLMGLFGAVAEVCVRIFFFNLYLKAGVHRNKKGTSKEQRLNTRSGAKYGYKTERTIC